MLHNIVDKKKSWILIGCVALLMALLLLVGMWGKAYAQGNGTEGSDIEVRPLSDVYADGPPEIVEREPTYATVAFVSSVPLVCSVVYGTDETYGQIATDLDMMGGAHTEHEPLLSGLLADTEYFYRVQGTDAAGNIYVGEPMTFRTPSKTPDLQSAINVAGLAAGASVEAVSSNFGNASNDGLFGANSALDGNAFTSWSSNGDGSDAFFAVRLSKPSLPHAVSIWTRSMLNGTAQISSFILTANAGTKTSETFGPFTLPDAQQRYRFDIAPTEIVETLRMDVVSSSGGNTGLVELEVFVDATVAATDTNSVGMFLPLAIQ